MSLVSFYDARSGLRIEWSCDDGRNDDTPEVGRRKSAHAETEQLKRLTTFWGLVSAYWLSERWREAWLLTGVVLAITLVLSKAAVWAATASAAFIASLADFHNSHVPEPALAILLPALSFFGISMAR